MLSSTIQTSATIVPTGRGATLVVAGAGAPAAVKAQANYVCDGTADNVEIQAAIDALTASRTWIETVKLIGSFSITTAVVLTDYTRLDMSEAHLTLANNSDSDMIYATGASYVHVFGGNLDGNAANNAGTIHCVHFATVLYSLIQNVRVTGSNFDGIRVDTSSSRISITSCFAEYSTRMGIRVSSSYRVSIVSNHVRNNSYSGIDIDSFSSGIEIIGNTTEANSGNGIFVEESSRGVMIMGNHSRENTGDGIDLNQEAAETLQSIVVEGNWAYRNTCHGIRVSANQNSTTARDIVICNNIVAENSYGSVGTYNGISVGASGTGVVTNVSVIGNMCTDRQVTPTQGYGVSIAAAGVTGAVVKDNDLRNNATGAISDSGTSTAIKQNQGYVTEISGSATVPNTATSVVVTHGLATTPTRVQITPRENPSNAITFWWVDTLTTTQFTINVDADPGASGLDFDWRAVIGEGN